MIQQRQQGQPENTGMRSLYRLEEMNPGTFELVATNTRAGIRTGKGTVACNLG